MKTERARKRSVHNLKLLIERVMTDKAKLTRGLWFCVDHVETKGYPIEKIIVWATMHFTPKGSSYCCGEPTCHFRWFDVSQHMRRALSLDQEVTVEFRNIRVEYHSGVEFKIG